MDEIQNSNLKKKKKPLKNYLLAHNHWVCLAFSFSTNFIQRWLHRLTIKDTIPHLTSNLRARLSGHNDFESATSLYHFFTVMTNERTCPKMDDWGRNLCSDRKKGASGLLSAKKKYMVLLCILQCFHDGVVICYYSTLAMNLWQKERKRLHCSYILPFQFKN